MYRKALLPTADKKKSRGRKLSYCQRLARHLDRLDENPELWKSDKTIKLPPFQRLPPELRQTILFHTLDDNEVCTPRPNSTTRDLALVCTQFAQDLPAVNRMWDARAASLSKLSGLNPTLMSALIKDMMGPLQTASAVLSSQKILRNSRSKRKASSRRNMQVDGAGISHRRQLQKERTAGSRSLRRSQHLKGGRPLTEEESVDMKHWRRARILAGDRVNAKLIIPRSNTRAESHSHARFIEED